MTASMIAQRKSGDILQTVSVTLHNAEVQNVTSQYETMRRFIQSLKNIFGTTSSDTTDFDITHVTMCGSGVAKNYLQQRCFGSVSHDANYFKNTFDFNEFAPYTISGGTTTYDVGTKINNIIGTSSVIDFSTWTFENANFVIYNNIVPPEE